MYLGNSALVSVAPDALPFPSRGRVCWKALGPAPLPPGSPGYKRTVLLEPALQYPLVTCSSGLRAWQGTCTPAETQPRAPQAQAGGRGPGERGRPSLIQNRRWAQQAPGPHRHGPLPGAAPSPIAHLLFQFLPPPPMFLFKLKKKKKYKLEEGEEELGMECCWRPSHVPASPLIPSKDISSSSYCVHLPCRLCGFSMAEMGVRPEPLVLACGRGQSSIVCKVQLPGSSTGAGWGPAT